MRPASVRGVEVAIHRIGRYSKSLDLATRWPLNAESILNFKKLQELNKFITDYKFGMTGVVWTRTWRTEVSVKAIAAGAFVADTRDQ